MHEFWADVIVAVHLGYMAYVVLGMLAIIIGMLLSWQWIRNPWFRLTHMAMILVVAFEALVEFTCPLTTWEHNLRKAAWQPWLHHLYAANAVALADSPMAPTPLVSASSLEAQDYLWDLWMLPWRPHVQHLQAASALALADAPLATGPLEAVPSFLAHDVWKYGDVAPADPQTFVARCLAWIMFPEVSEEVLTGIYYTFAGVVVLSFVLAPPRFRRKRQITTAEPLVAASGQSAEK